MPVDAPTRYAPTRTPITHDAHGIVPFNRRGSEPSEDKKLDNGGGNGGKPPVGGNGKGGGDNRRYCKQWISDLFVSSSNTKKFYELYFETFLRGNTVIDLIGLICESYALHINRLIKFVERFDKKIEKFKISGEKNKIKINIINKTNDLNELNNVKANYKNQLLGFKEVITDVLDRCDNFLTAEQLAKLKEVEKSTDEQLEQLNKIEIQLNSILKGNHKTSLKPLAILRPVTKTPIQRSPVNVLSDNLLNYANQAVTLRDKLFRKMNSFTISKPQTPAQFDAQMRQEQRDELERRKKAANNEAAMRLLPYAPVLMRYAPLLGL